MRGRGLRGRRWRRWAVRGAVAALGLAALGLAAGGGGEELLAAALAAWWGGWGEPGVAEWGGWRFGAGGVRWAGGNGSGAAGNPSEGVAGNAGGGVATPLPPLLLSPPPCGPTPPFLLVLVPSAPPHFAQRQAIRDTWGGGDAAAPLPTRTLFVLGVPAEGGDATAATAATTAATQAALAAEARRHRDLLQGTFGDTYANLTRKTLLLLRWAAARCPAAPFLLKADDDVFVNLPALAAFLGAFRNLPPLYLGRVHWAVAPQRDPRSRHHVPAALYPAARFPPYCSGTAYVLSAPGAAALLAAAPRVPLVAPEDVWVGLCARRAGLSPRHSARMGGSARFPPDPCCYGEVLFSAHRLRPPQLRGVWGALRGGGGEGEGGAGRCGWGQRALGVLRCRALSAAQWLWE